METGQLAVSQRSQNTTVNQEQRMKTEQKLYNTGFGNDFLRYDAKGTGNEKITNWTS